MGLADARRDCDSVIIHEAVRPLVTVDEFRALIAADDPNAMFGIPIPFTVLKGHDYVEDLLERDELVNVQLPQKFDRAKLVGRPRGRPARRHVVHRGRQPVPPLRRGAGADPARARSGTSRSRSRPTSSPPRRSTPTSSAAGADDGQGLRHHRGQPGHRPSGGDPDEPRAGRRRRSCSSPGTPTGSQETAAAMDATGTRRSSCIPYDLTDLDGIPELVRAHPRDATAASTSCSTSPATPTRSRSSTRRTENIVTTYTINVFAMLMLIREAARYMVDRPAKILNVASTAGITSRPGWLAYASSKAAVVSLSATLADELAGSGIKVYSISPGPDRHGTASQARAGGGPEHDHAAEPRRRRHRPADERRRDDARRPEHRRPDAGLGGGEPARIPARRARSCASPGLLLAGCAIRRDRVVLATARVADPRRQPAPPPSARSGRRVPTSSSSSCSSRTATGSPASSPTSSGWCAGMYHLQTARLFVVDNAYLPIHVAPHRPDDDRRPGLARGRRAQAVRAGHAHAARPSRSGRSCTATTTRSSSAAEWAPRAVRGRAPDAARARPRARLAADRLLLRRGRPWTAARERVLDRAPGARRAAGRPLRADVPRPGHRQAGRRRARRRAPPGGPARRPRPRAQDPSEPRPGRDRDRRLRRRGRPERPRSTTCCALTDVLITDYSSSVVEFALLHRPIVLLVGDLAEYEVDPGLYLDYRTEMIGTQVADTDGVIDGDPRRAVRPVRLRRVHRTPARRRSGAGPATGSSTGSSAADRRAGGEVIPFRAMSATSEVPAAFRNAAGDRGPLRLIGEGINDIRSRRRLVRYLVQADIRKRGADTLLGNIWWVLDPLLQMVVYVVFLSIVVPQRSARLPALHLRGDPALEVVLGVDHRRHAARSSARTS